MSEKLVGYDALAAIASDIKTAIGTKADASTTYDKTEVDTALSAKADKSDTYTKAQVDSAVGAKADASSVYTKTQTDDLLAGKADTDGSYDNMTVGNAKQLVSKITETDKVPYLFRTSGGSIDIGDRETDKLVGGTVAFNQLVNTGDTSIDTTSGHKYYTSINGTKSIIQGGSAVSINDSSEDNVIDLTALFGSQIADCIYSLESGTTGAGVAWLKAFNPKMFGKYNAYNAGSFLHVKTSAHETTGFNQFDVENADLHQEDFAGTSSTENVTTRNYTPVLPNTVYCFHQNFVVSGRYIKFYDIDKNEIPNSQYVSYSSADFTFTTPENAYFVRFMWYKSGGVTISTVTNGEVNINFHWDGERDGEYEPYVKNTYPLDADLELRGIPKLDTDNKLFYDGDEYSSDGNVLRRYGLVDLGSLNWSYNSETQIFITDVNLKKVGRYNLICSKYVTSVATSITNIGNKEILGGGSTNQIIIKDTDYTDAATFKTAMSGVYLVYELATPTEETADEYQNPQLVDNFGTEAYIDGRAVEIPVGHDTVYQANLRAKIETAPDVPNADGDYILRQTSGANVYVLKTNELPALPTTDGTYTLKCTVASGTATLSWVADE